MNAEKIAKKALELIDKMMAEYVDGEISSETFEEACEFLGLDEDAFA